MNPSPAMRLLGTPEAAAKGRGGGALAVWPLTSPWPSL
eukprot:CAMPEP_0118879846 /NCGR_PEP_ID=MMETSP1163-20130328/19533_1 /TAXON_ID=124430 /ORGANISM="Phaeomonas parva, Strain CCMP2877" /LENGTH=37 /DNA_ID= /DNA_START= /DNA_END= /DNA_ORIENTATION=